jgi:uncharacterized membrane protein
VLGKTSLRGAGVPPAALFATAAAVLSAFGTLAWSDSLPAAACSANKYRVVALPLIASAINASGRVVGHTAANRAAVWSARDGLRELPMPDGYVRADAVAVNRAGHVLVMAYNQTLLKHQGFLYADGRMKVLPGEGVRAFALSDDDTVAGESLADGTPSSEPSYWVQLQRKGIANCCGGTAKGINVAGLVIGDLYDANGHYSAFAWKAGGEPRPIGPVGTFSSAVAVNAAGTVVIQAFPGVYLYKSGELERLTLAPRYPSHPHAINACDLLVGAFGPYSDKELAFVWDRTTGFQDLNLLIPADSDWKLESANGVNDRGEIVGRADRTGPGEHKGEGQDDVGFLLVPVP